MRFLVLPLFASLLLVRGADRAVQDGATVAPVEVAPAEAAETEALAEPVTASLLPPPAATTIRETGAPVPADLVTSVRATKGGGWQVRLTRKGHLVAMRRGGDRTAGENEATLALAAVGADPVVWETTKLDTLATVRGTLRLDDAGTPHARLQLAEAPVPAGHQEGPLHTCAAHEDGAGGFTVLCRVRAHVTAANVTGEEASTDVWVAGRDGAEVARLDLPASPEGFDARVLGYSHGVEGVVLRAEASRAAGEDRPVLTLLAAERAQPQVPRQIVRYVCCRLPAKFF